jgi:hypothetical protein
MCSHPANREPAALADALHSRTASKGAQSLKRTAKSGNGWPKNPAIFGRNGINCAGWFTKSSTA